MTKKNIWQDLELCKTKRPPVTPGYRPRPQRRKGVKLTVEQVIEIRRKHATGQYKLKQLAPEYGVSMVTISEIVRRIKWPYV